MCDHRERSRGTHQAVFTGFSEGVQAKQKERRKGTRKIKKYCSIIETTHDTTKENVGNKILSIILMEIVNNSISSWTRTRGDMAK